MSAAGLQLLKKSDGFKKDLSPNHNHSSGRDNGKRPSQQSQSQSPIRGILGREDKPQYGSTSSGTAAQIKMLQMEQAQRAQRAAAVGSGGQYYHQMPQGHAQQGQIDHNMPRSQMLSVHYSEQQHQQMQAGNQMRRGTTQHKQGYLH